MNEVETAPAQLTTANDRVQATFVRRLDHSTDRVWAALTRPEWLANWLAPGEVQPRYGGSARLNFVNSGILVDSTVTWCRPRRLLEYSWSGPGEPQRPVRWRLWPTGRSCTDLSLRLSLPAEEDVAKGFAGWDAHLEMLAAALEGVAAKFPYEHFKARRAHYAERLMLAETLAAA
ncbi:MAG TPA: SRPBCC domain-containing protein [Phenylobacterium sp.]